MLALLFSFRGRIGRLTYFLTVLGVAVALLTLLGVFFLAAADGLAHRSNLGTVVGLGLLVLVAALATLWVALALQAKRIRDIGLDPILVIPGIMLFGTFDAGVANAMPHLAISHSVHQTLLGFVVNLCISGALLFWPGQSSGGEAPPAERMRPEPAPAAPAQRPAPTPTSAWPAAPARTGFGKRGLV